MLITNNLRNMCNKFAYHFDAAGKSSANQALQLLYLLKSGSICRDLKSRGIFLKITSHLSRSVKGTLRNTENVVGNFGTCTGSYYGGFKIIKEAETDTT